ncbi:MAG: hypothetical protein J7530_04720 [Novosphingobium sp.]|nr:hypothetical protein [Novosphingobium sp.]
MGRAVILLAGLVALSGCHKEPSFEERYDAANENIAKRARDIDARIAGTDTPPAQDASKD